eukprot:3694244-Prymnesium_polylepis.1
MACMPGVYAKVGSLRASPPNMHCAKVTKRHPHVRTNLTRSGMSQSGPWPSVMKRSLLARLP